MRFEEKMLRKILKSELNCADFPNFILKLSDNKVVGNVMKQYIEHQIFAKISISNNISIFEINRIISNNITKASILFE